MNRQSGPDKPYTVEFVAHVVKECMGEANIEEDDCNAELGIHSVSFGKNGRLSTQNKVLDNVHDTQGGERGVIAFLVAALKRGHDDVKDYEGVYEKAKEKKKRKAGNKAEATNDALDIAGSSSEEKNQILKDA